MDISDRVSNFIERCVDEFIALIVIGGVFYLVSKEFEIPAAMWVAFGIVIENYFRKKTIKYLNNKKSGSE